MYKIKILNLALAVLMAFCAVGCVNAEQPDKSKNIVQNEEKVTVKMQKLKIRINGQQFTAELYDNPTVHNFIGRLPLTLNMKDLHGNEKYCYLDDALPCKNKRVGRINAGDIMLFGSDCLVVFYKSFNTSYSYTPFGKIENANALEKVLGHGNVQMEFSL